MLWLWHIRYRFIAPFASLIEPFLRPSWHRGKRASTSLERADIRLPIDKRRFERCYYISLWQSFRMLQFASTAPLEFLREFLTRRVPVHGSTSFPELASMDRGVLITSPHYGAFIICCLKIIFEMHGKKKVHVLYNDPRFTPSNSTYGPLFQRLGYDVNLLFVGRKGSIAALKALRRNECVLIMPDVVLDTEQAIAIPFMNRLLRVMPGTGFFALKGNAIIAPVYCSPMPDFSVSLRIGNLVDAADYIRADDAQTIFATTRTLFQDFEKQYADMPEHWNYWDRLASQSRPLGDLDVDDPISLREALVRRVKSSPKLAAAIPELEPFLRNLDHPASAAISYTTHA